MDLGLQNFICMTKAKRINRKKAWKDSAINWYVFLIVSKLPKTTTAYRKSKFLPVHVVLSLMIAIVASNVILFYRELLNATVEGVLQQLC